MARRRDSCFLQPPPHPTPADWGRHHAPGCPAHLERTAPRPGFPPRPRLLSHRQCVLEKTMRVCRGDCPVPGLSRCLRGSSRLAKPPGVWLRLPPRGHVLRRAPEPLPQPWLPPSCVRVARLQGDGRCYPSVNQDAPGPPACHSQGPLEAVVPGAEAGSPCCPPGRPGHQPLYPGQVSHQLSSQETGPCLVILCSDPTEGCWREAESSAGCPQAPRQDRPLQRASAAGIPSRAQALARF